MITATPQSVREGSGTFLAVSALAEGLRSAGHQVRLLTPNRPPGPLGYTLHRFRFNRELEEEMTGGTDLVLGWDMDGYRLAGTLCVPFVAYVHGVIAEEARFERGGVRLSMRWQAHAERRNVRTADAVLTVSDHARQRLAAAYGIPSESIGVVPPAFDAARWHSTLQRIAPSDAPVPPTVLCVARFYPRKDQATLVRAAALLRRTTPDLRVVLVGDGPERPRVIRLVRRLGLVETVRFAGQLSFDDLALAYRRCDVCCLPSRQEGFGLVVLEALAAGKPVVTCRDTAAEELVGDRDGTVVPQADPRALAEALDDWLTQARSRETPPVMDETRFSRFAPVRVARQLIATLEPHVAAGTPGTSTP
jgi:glycosyltransferase involved in cell wall biosynthesis